MAKVQTVVGGKGASVQTSKGAVKVGKLIQSAFDKLDAARVALSEVARAMCAGPFDASEAYDGFMKSLGLTVPYTSDSTGKGADRVQGENDTAVMGRLQALRVPMHTYCEGAKRPKLSPRIDHETKTLTVKESEPRAAKATKEGSKSAARKVKAAQATAAKVMDKGTDTRALGESLDLSTLTSLAVAYVTKQGLNGANGAARTLIAAVAKAAGLTVSITEGSSLTSAPEIAPKRRGRPAKQK